MNHFKIPKALIDKESFLINSCRNLDILDVGCADFPYTVQAIRSMTWLHQKIRDVSKTCTGLDKDETSVEILRDMYGFKNIVHGDVEQLGKLSLGKYDVIVAGELIEHLNNPGLFLETARHVLKPTGKMIITTTNAFCLRKVFRIPFGKESVHPDHTYYFSHTTLRTLAERFHWNLLEAYSYRISNKKPLLPYVFERFATSISPNWGEGIVHVYRLENQ